LLAAAGALCAQTPTPVTVQFGGLFCGAVRRDSAQVQTYCYLYPAAPTWVLVNNQIANLPPAGGVLLTMFNWCKTYNAARGCTAVDIINWQFTWDGPSAFSWSFVWDGLTIHSGLFQ